MDAPLNLQVIEQRVYDGTGDTGKLGIKNPITPFKRRTYGLRLSVPHYIPVTACSLTDLFLDQFHWNETPVGMP